MRDFVLPYKPEELLAQPSDDRLWASNLPDVENWTQEESDEAINAVTRRVLKSQGRDLADDKTFSILFALVQSWASLEEGLHVRVAELLTDALHRLMADAARLKKADKGVAKSKEKEAHVTELQEVRTAVKIAIFYLRLTTEKVLQEESKVSRKRRGKATGRGDDDKGGDDKEKQKATERQRCALLSAIADSISKGAMPWLWLGDTAAWQQVAEKVSDAGFSVLDAEQVLKHKETKQLGLRCVVGPLQQEGHDHSNLLVATVSKLTHGLRGHELAAPFAADAVAMAHNTPLPRTLLMELTQLCMGTQLSLQGGFQRSLGNFISGLAERLPHVVLANIAVLLELLNVDCYPLRSAMVESIGALLNAEGRPLPKGTLCTAFAAQGGENDADAPCDENKIGSGEVAASDMGPSCFKIASSTKTDLLETLMTRTTDKTVWVRVQTLRALTSLAQTQKALPKELWPRALQIGTKRMQDSACSARKAALGLVHALIQLHPYGPALKGSGDERAKTEQVLRYIGDRKQTLIAEAAAEELKHAEEALENIEAAEGQQEETGGVVAELPTSHEEWPMKRRRLGGKTKRSQATLEYEVDEALAAENEEGEARHDQRNRQVKTLENMEQCYADRFKFVEMLDMAETRLRALLVSRSPSDVIEAIGVVVELKRRGLPAAARAFNQILGLVWSRHANVKDAAVEAFFNMHLEGHSPEQAVQSLLEMYQLGCTAGGWTYTHLSSVSELIQQAATQQRIESVGAIRCLVRELQGLARPMALRTLTALGAADATGLAKTLPQLVELFGPSGQCWGQDPAQRLENCRLLCLLLQRLHSCVKPQFASNSAELGHIFTLIQQSTRVVLEEFGKGAVDPAWYGAVQATMDLSFEVSAYASTDSPAGLGCPDKQWESILEAMFHTVCQSAHLESSADLDVAVAVSPEDGAIADDAAMSGVDEDRTQINEERGHAVSNVKASAGQLSCAVFMVGHLALRMVIYMENTQALLKKKRMSEEDARLAAEREKKNHKETKTKGKKSAAKEEVDAKKEEEEASSMGMAGQEEREADHFAEMIEQRLLYNPKSILSRARPLLLRGLCDSHQRGNSVVRRVAAISLCKCMTVSKRFCEEYLQLLFSVLFPTRREQSDVLLSNDGPAQDAATSRCGPGELLEDITLRQSLLVAVGDLLFRHPNVVEPWTDRLYTALGAPTGATAERIANATNLRLTALLVLTHLVLNDMMKPRAVLLGRALWLTACPHESTARVARILFQELSKRSTNVIYNLLPEVVARLPEQRETGSVGSVATSAEDRVSWVMQFVEKEKHIEGLIEKFSIRLEQSADIKGMGKDGCKANDATSEGDEHSSLPLDVSAAGALEAVSCLAHAIGAMNYSDRCICRLHDVIVIRKALNTAISYHHVVRDCLLGIVEKMRKPRVGKAADGQAPETEGADAGAAGGKGKPEAAAMKAVDEIEQVINTLGSQKIQTTAGMDTADVVVVPTPQSRVLIPAQESKHEAKKGKGKRKQEEADEENAGFEKEPKNNKVSKRKQEEVSHGPVEVPLAQVPAQSSDVAAPSATSAPAVQKVKSGGEELRAALQAQKAARKGKGNGRGKGKQRVTTCDDHEE